jgi:hypothetical protein
MQLEEDDNAEEKKEAVSDSVSAVAVDEHDGSSSNEGNTCTSSSESSSSDMRGVFCKSPIAPNTVCMAVPRKCLITVEMGQATSIGQQILHADLDLDAPKHIFLMIYVLQDRRNPESFFKPYYDVLPKTLSMPIFWEECDLQYLEGSYLLQQIADRVEAIEEDYKAICDVCPQLSEIATLNEFKWARMCVCSRNFGLQIDGARTSAMVPHADMLNHYRPRETKWTFDDERQAFTITTLQTIQSGSEIFDSYGQKCNHRFLLNYGFAVEHNVELDGFCPNEVPIEVSLSGVVLDNMTDRDMDSDLDMESDHPLLDPLSEEKREFWCRDETPLCKRVRVCVSNNENTKMLFSLLRVVVADAMEFEAIMVSGTHPSTPLSVSSPPATTTHTTTSKSPTSSASANAAAATIVRNHPSAGGIHGGLNLHTALSGYRSCRDIRFPISIRNETAMLQQLLKVTRQYLSHYPTTMAQDKEGLQKKLHNNTGVLKHHSG